MKRTLSILLCIVFLFCLASCQPQDTNPTPPEESKDVHSDVTDFKRNLKKNPHQYIDTQVTLKGTVIQYDTKIYLIDCADNEIGQGVSWRYEIKKNEYITAFIPDEVKLAVLEDGDYIEISGVLKMADGEFYLDNCDYTLIKTFEERKG